MPYKKVASGVYLVGGDTLSHANDCLVYLVAGPPAVLIDAGANRLPHRILDNLAEAIHDVQEIAYCVLTHCHVDHIGGAEQIREAALCRLVAHEDDAEAIQNGDPVRTAAKMYGIKLPKIELDDVLFGDGGECGGLNWLHTPGHTPGSIGLYCDTPDGRILFGQDVHGPFLPDFGSDLDQWRASMDKLLALEADILCEGHFGVIRGKDAVAKFIHSHLDANR
jgi:glyoxylase-like metal-dependent hydrolase (beta-lactamase superfamily II)